MLFISSVIIHMVENSQGSWLLVQNSLVFSLSFRCCLNFIDHNVIILPLKLYGKVSTKSHNS